MSGGQIAEEIKVSKSGVNGFLRAFKECKTLGYPLPQGITNYGIAEAVYGKSPGGLAGRDLSYEMPDYAAVEKEISHSFGHGIPFAIGLTLFNPTFVL